MRRIRNGSLTLGAGLTLSLKRTESLNASLCYDYSISDKTPIVKPKRNILL